MNEAIIKRLDIALFQLHDLEKAQVWDRKKISGYHGFRRGERDGWMNRKNRRFFRSVKLNCIIHNTRKTMISHVKLCKISISSIVLLEDEITSFD